MKNISHFMIKSDLIGYKELLLQSLVNGLLLSYVSLFCNGDERCVLLENRTWLLIAKVYFLTLIDI